MNRRHFLRLSAAGAAAGTAIVASNRPSFGQTAPFYDVGRDDIEAFDPGGDTYGQSPTRTGVVRRRTNGSFVWSQTAFGTGSNQFNNPRALAFDATTGRLYILDNGNHRVQVMTSAGAFISAFGSFGSGAGQLRFPTDIVLGPGPLLYVSDTMNHRIVVFDTGGIQVGTFGTFGTTGNGLNGPRGLAFHPDGTLHVVDSGNGRVVIFQTNGTFVGSYGTLSRPYSIAIDVTGRRFVTDPTATLVTVFDGATVTTTMVKFANNQVGTPIDIIVQPNGRIYVSAIPFGGYLLNLPVVPIQRAL